MTTKPLIHYVFRHSIGMVQMQEGEDLGAIERVCVEAVVMVVDGVLTDSGKKVEFFIKGGSWNAPDEGVAGMMKIEQQFYSKPGISL